MNVQLSITSLVRAVGLVALLGSAVGAVPQSSDQSSIVGSDRLGSARWSILRSGTSELEIVRETLSEQGTSSGLGSELRASQRRVWVPHEPGPSAWVEGLTLGHLGGGDRWRLAAVLFGGALNHVRIWDIDASADAAPRVLAARSIHKIALPDRKAMMPEQAAVAYDLTSPCLIERNGGQWLIVSAAWNGETSLDTNRVIVLSKLGVDLNKETPIQGTIIASGADPRVIDLGDELVLAVRQLTNGAQSWGEAPLRFYRTRDLATWTEDQALASGIEARSSFTLQSHGTTLWLGTWTQGDAEGAREPKLVVWRFDQGSKAWRREESISGARVRGGPLFQGIWWLPDERASSTRPRIAFETDTGTIGVR